jgi:hypothetical protein
MGALILAFWRILLLRAGPQSVPASITVLWLVLLLHFAVGLLLALFAMPFFFSLLYALVSTLSMVAMVHGLMLLFKKPARTLQSMSALAAGEALLGLLLLPLSLLYYLGSQGDETSLLLALLSLLVMGWNVALAAHIFRHALGVSRGLGFLYSVVYLIMAVTLSDMVSMAGGAG